MTAGPRVLVTRPRPGAEATAHRLAELGLQPVVIPLTETRAVPCEPLLARVDAVAVTSAAAIRHAPSDLIAGLRHLPCFTVGGRTSETARHAGFRDIRQGGGDAAGLAAVIADTMPGGSAVAWLCGRLRLPAFGIALEATGITVHPVETYDTLPSPEAAQALGTAAAFDAVLLHSATTAEILRDIVRRRPGPFASAWFLCLSERVAAALGEPLNGRCLVAPAPQEDALLALLRPWPPRRPFSREAGVLGDARGDSRL